MSAYVAGGAYICRFPYRGWHQATFLVQDSSLNALPNRKVILLGQRPLVIVSVGFTDASGEVTFTCLPDDPDNLFVVAFGVEGLSVTADVSDRLIALTPMSYSF